MNTEVISVDRATAQFETDELVGHLINAVGKAPKVQGSSPDPHVIAAVHQILMDESTLERGDFLSRIQRLPQVWGNVLREYINRSKPYDSVSFNLESTLRNVGTKSVSILVDVHTIQTYNPSSGEKSDNYRNFPMRQVLEPGEEITLPAHRALDALWKYGRNGYPIALWGPTFEADASRERPLVEVAYRATIVDISNGLHNARPVVVDSREFQKSKSEKQKKKGN